MTALKIDKQVPLPSGRRGNRPEVLQALKTMEVGDSFFYPDIRDSFRGNVYWRAGYVGIKVTVKRVTEDGIDGVRVWRIEK